MLDYTADAETLGKNIGDDLAEGKPTLPLIRAMQAGTQEQQAMLREAIEQGGRDYTDRVMSAIESTDAIEYTSRLAKEEADKAKAALSDLPASSGAVALNAAADHLVERADADLQRVGVDGPGRLFGQLSHDLAVVEYICDRIVVMKQAIIAATGSPDEVMTHGLLRDVYGINAEIGHDQCGLWLAPLGLTRQGDTG